MFENGLAIFDVFAGIVPFLVKTTVDRQTHSIRPPFLVAQNRATIARLHERRRKILPSPVRGAGAGKNARLKSAVARADFCLEPVSIGSSSR